MMKQREIKLFWKAKQNASTKLIYLVFIEALKSINISKNANAFLMSGG